MPTSFLDLTNTLLQDFNEPTLTAGNFSSVRSVHRVAKNAINRSIDYIQTKEYTWPFMKASGSQTLSTGTINYSWPPDMKTVDMESFYILKDDALGVATTRLKEISETEWRNRYRKGDLDADSSAGIRVPQYVFRTNTAYGVTPVTNNNYALEYEYWKTWTRLISDTDQSDIPSEWDHVIIANAYPFMYKFYNDDAGRDRAVDDAEKILRDMRQLLVPKDPHVWTGQLLVGGYYAQ